LYSAVLLYILLKKVTHDRVAFYAGNLVTS